jgi:long-chain fatty acid transport protein
MLAKKDKHVSLPTRCPGLGLLACVLAAAAHGQGSSTLGNGLSAAAIARGGETVTERSSPLDAVEGNPAGLVGTTTGTLDLGAVGLVAGGSFSNAVNPSGSLRGVAGALPYGVYAAPAGGWVLSAGVTPQILMKANWHYNDAPGTLGVTYGYQQQESQTIAVRSSVGAAREFGAHWSAGATLGVVYNYNDLHAPYIFQTQPQLAGLKVLLGIKTQGYGWNGSAGVQWQPSSRMRAGLAWKSGTTLRTVGRASGTASALFTALKITADPTYAYHAQVENHLPQAFAGGVAWRTRGGVNIAFEGAFTAWGQAFQQLPITLTQGTNATINSVVGANNFNDTVPLNWRNQGTFHGGIELPVREVWTVRAGYTYGSNPVPSTTLTPLTAAIMQQGVATGAGWTRNRWRYDIAYQAQLPVTETVTQSILQAGEYNNSKVRVWTQSVTLSARVKF